MMTEQEATFKNTPVFKNLKEFTTQLLSEGI